jgi:DNA-binding NtrC family response regulator
VYRLRRLYSGPSGACHLRDPRYARYQRHWIEINAERSYEMLVAKTAAKGLDLLASHEVQVIVCDQQMPLADGGEFLDNVNNLYPGAVRIVLSADADLHAVTDAINRSAIYRFLTKPWESGLLRESLREAFHHYWMMHDTPSLPIKKAARQQRVDDESRYSDLESV